MMTRLLTFFLPLCLSLSPYLLRGQPAQDMRARIAADNEIAGGYFCHYPAPPENGNVQAAPKGFAPFYISHFGRHGCRHHTDGGIYERSAAMLELAGERHALTEEGKDLLERMRYVCSALEDRYGDLSPRGKEEHRGIAERMYGNYPEVFRPHHGDPAKIWTRSTTSLRCVMSMTAFNERLKEIDPRLRIVSECSRRGMRDLAGDPVAKEAEVYSRVWKVVDSLRRDWVDPQPFLDRIFSDPDFIREEIRHPEVYMYEFFLVAVIMQDAQELGITFFDCFTEEELHVLWKVLNMQGYCTMAPSAAFGGPVLEGVEPVLEELVTTADKVIAGELPFAATLRFGHDSALIPLFSLMGLEDIALDLPYDEVAEQWNLSDISPMASNLQMVFFRNRRGDVRVRVLRNEKDARLPLEGAPFYDWNVLREYLLSRLDPSLHPVTGASR